jgi:YVTN family beta-propeller protein
VCEVKNLRKAFAAVAFTSIALGLASCGSGVGSGCLLCTTTVTRQFAYVVNKGGNSVSAYTVDPTTGALGSIAGSPFAAGTNPASVTVATASAAGKSSTYVYAANNGSNNVSAYTVAPTGSLAPVAGSPFAAGTGPISAAADAGGRFVYVVNQGSNDVSAYAIDAATGALTAIAGSPFAAGTNPTCVTLASGSTFVFVVNSGSNNVSAYSIGATGALTAVAGSPFAAGSNPACMTDVQYAPTREFAYVVNRGSNNISAYTIGTTTGALTAAAGSPFVAGSNPTSVSVDPTGRFAYVANQGSNNVSAYNIDAATGALTALSGSPFTAGTGPASVTVVAYGPTQEFAYVVNNGSNNVSAYAIEAVGGLANSGALTAVSGSPFVAGTSPNSVATVTITLLAQ